MEMITKQITKNLFAQKFFVTFVTKISVNLFGIDVKSHSATVHSITEAKENVKRRNTDFVNQISEREQKSAAVI